MGKKSKNLDESVVDTSIQEATTAEEAPLKTYDELLINLQEFSHPLATKKLTKKIYKVVKKASKAKELRRGVKDVNKRIRKGEKGLVVLAGDTYPIDVVSHIPVCCEEANIPYVYVPSKEYLGKVGGSSRQACTLLVKSHEDYKDLFSEVCDAVKLLPNPL